MYWPRLVVLALTAGLLGGCPYAPLAVDENLPQVEDQVQDHEIVVTGQSRIHVYKYDSNDNYQFICWLYNDVRGWEEYIEPDDAGCSGCAEGYTLVLDPSDEGSCDFGIAGAPSIAITQLGFFPWTDFSEYVVERLTTSVPDEAAGPAIAYASTNWTPGGETDWGERMAVHELAGGPAEGYSRAYYVRPFFAYRTSQGYLGSWSMDLHILE